MIDLGDDFIHRHLDRRLSVGPAPALAKVPASRAQQHERGSLRCSGGQAPWTRTIEFEERTLR